MFYALQSLSSKCIAIIMLLGLSLVSHANYADLERDLLLAYYQGDKNTLEHYHTQAQGINQVYAGYALAIYLQRDGQHDNFNQVSERLIQQLDALMEQDSNNVDLLSLQSVVLGFLAQSETSQQQQLFQKSGAAISMATQIDATNPRVQLVKGIAALYTPASYGGGSEKAVKHFEAAIKQFKTLDSKGWGYADAYVWLGKARNLQNKPEEAKAYWQKALEIAPEFAWPRFLISQVK